MQVVLPHIKGTMEALHVGEVMTAMPLAKHLPPSLVDVTTAEHLKAFILRFFEVQKALKKSLIASALSGSFHPCFFEAQKALKNTLIASASSGRVHPRFFEVFKSLEEQLDCLCFI